MELLRQQLSIDSFSYNWLLNIKPSIDSLDDGLRFSLDTQDAGSFIEMEAKLISMRPKADSIDFDFSLPSSQSPVLIHVDQIFSNGLLLPLHLINPPKSELPSNSSPNSVMIRSLSIDSSESLLSGSNRFYTVPSSPISLNASSLFSPVQGVPTSSCSSSSRDNLSRGNDSKLHFLGSCTKSSKRFFQRYLEFSHAYVQEVQGLETEHEGGRPSSELDEELHGIIGASPRTTDALLSFECCHGWRTFDVGTENVIHDAILHCKNSIRESLRLVA